MIYVGVNIMGASHLVSIVGWSPLFHGNYLVEEIPVNFTVFGGVVMTVAIPFA